MNAITIEMKKLRKDIDKIIDEYLQKIVKIILQATKNYPIDWDKYYNEIENLFYEFLEKVYNLVINYLNQIYEELPDFSVEDIFDLAYDIDGKKITERLREYWDEAAQRINEESNNNHINVQNYLINMYDRILFTESRVVESKIKEFKKPINASMLIIESGCENCGENISAEEKILEAIRENPKITQKQLAAVSWLSLRGVEWNMAKLKNEGKIKRLGSDKKGTWEIVE